MGDGEWQAVMHKLVFIALSLSALLAHAAQPGNPQQVRRVAMPAFDVRLELFREAVRPSVAAPRVIERCALPLPAGGAEALLAQPIELLPYFGHQAPPTTLSAFLAAQADKWGMAHYKMFPETIGPFMRLPAATRAEHDTLAGPKGLARKQAVVAWKGESLWYVDRVYYRFTALDVERLAPQACTEVVAATWDEFVKASPIVMQRLLEFRNERRQPDFPMVSPDVPAIELLVTAGMPNTSSYWAKVYPDGQLEVGGSSKNLAPLKTTRLLVRAAQVMRQLARDASSRIRTAARPAAHDAQQRILSLAIGGQQGRFELDEEAPAAATAFAAEVTTGLSQ